MVRSSFALADPRAIAENWVDFKCGLGPQCDDRKYAPSVSAYSLFFPFSPLFLFPSTLISFRFNGRNFPFDVCFVVRRIYAHMTDVSGQCFAAQKSGDRLLSSHTVDHSVTAICIQDIYRMCSTSARHPSHVRVVSPTTKNVRNAIPAVRLIVKRNEFTTERFILRSRVFSDM